MWLYDVMMEWMVWLYEEADEVMTRVDEVVVVDLTWEDDVVGAEWLQDEVVVGKVRLYGEVVWMLLYEVTVWLYDGSVVEWVWFVGEEGCYKCCLSQVSSVFLTVEPKMRINTYRTHSLCNKKFYKFVLIAR